MQILESDQTVSKYTYEPFQIEYILNGKLKHYIPDFLVEYGEKKLLLKLSLLNL